MLKQKPKITILFACIRYIDIWYKFKCERSIIRVSIMLIDSQVQLQICSDTNSPFATNEATLHAARDPIHKCS